MQRLWGDVVINKFTKDELETIWCACDHYPAAFPLLEKIQSMINNYCEHKHIEPDSAMINVCMKCGAGWQ